MNAKKNKYKNKPKPVNPSPQQKEEIVQKIEEKVEPIVPIQTEERVPEIVSAVVPQIQDKISENDTPKKPKRNRGKRKKSDKDYELTDESQDTEKKSSEMKASDDKAKLEPGAAKLIEKPKDLLSMNEPSTETTNVTPIECKKQLNKKNVDPPERQELVQNVEIQNKLDMATLENEPKTPKKKNKKKKRNDSERSEDLAVTAAFQKLLEPQSDITETKTTGVKQQSSSGTVAESLEKNIEKSTEPKLETDIIFENKPNTPEPSKEVIKSNKKNQKDKKYKKGESQEKILKSEPETKEISLESKQGIIPVIKKEQKPMLTESKKSEIKIKEEGDIQKPTSKSQDCMIDAGNCVPECKNEDNTAKKKKKKDKKEVVQTDVVNLQQDKSDLFETNSNVPKPTESFENKRNKKETAEPRQREEDNLHKELLSQEKPKVEKEKSPKLKAKTTKPVEKNHKETNDSPTTKNITSDAEKDSSTTKVSTEPKTDLTLLKEIEDLDAKALTQIPLTTEKFSENKQELVNPLVQIENIDTLEQQKEIKRKKSPKLSKCNKNEQQTINLMPHNNELESSSEVKETITDLDSVIKLEEENIILEQTKKHDVKSKPAETESSFSTDVPSSLSMIEEQSECLAKTMDLHANNMSLNKKRKKSPKPPNNKRQTKTQDSITKDSERKHKCTDFETEMSLEESSATLSPSLLPEIEIRSIQTEESEGSICDITPDIHYPRSSSEFDDNNNTRIQEITYDSTKLNMPVTSPLIHGSGETPLPTPELSSCGVEITEIFTGAHKTEQKTDLKSKVMEVNKDMEELRKSIERSLAELTAIEKSEESAETQYIAAPSNKSDKIDVETEQKSSPKEYKKTGVEKLAQIIAEQTLCESKATATDKIVEKKQQAEQKPDFEPQSEPSDLQKINELLLPIQPPKRENKGKGKSKKKGKQDIEHSTTPNLTLSSSTTPDKSNQENTASSSTGETKETQKTKKEEKTENTASNQEKEKQQSDGLKSDSKNETDQADFKPIEAFEDAMTSSTDVDDINKTFEIIARNANDSSSTSKIKTNPEISVTSPVEDDENQDKKSKRNPVSPSKNLLGRPDIPVRLNRPDYKKEKNKTPNMKQARVKIKDDVPIETNKQSKEESQTENRNGFLEDKKSVSETINCMTAENEDFVYKYSFRKVFLPRACHICKKDLKQSRIPCSFCNLVFYCSPKHKDEDYQQHQSFCFAVSTIGHLKDQKHIYADSQNVTGHDYRLLRMQMIVSCEKVLKRKLHAWEQEALLYPRLCADVSCREWRQLKLKDCEGCGQISFCGDKPDHLPSSHQSWCKSYLLYHKLVCYQQTKGRLEPKLPTKVMKQMYKIPEKFNDVLGFMYEEKIDINDIQYAALTQIATAPLTAAYCQQLYTNKMNKSYANGVHKKSFTIHVVGAELQFEADALNKWELFFLHLKPDVTDLRVVLIGQELNPSNLPLDLLGKIKVCETCRQNKRRVIFEFQDKKSYPGYWATDFSLPDMVCAFNPSIQRSSIYNGKDTWPSTIKLITKLKVPFVITSYTLNELTKDLAKVKSSSDVDVTVISEPKLNAFASVRPDRNFITDDEMPLLFKNYYYAIVCGSL